MNQLAPLVSYLGHKRLDTVVQTLLLDQLYDKLWLYYQFFQPVMRMTSKETSTKADGSIHTQRHFDQPRTPYERLCAANALTPEKRAELEQLRQQSNPRSLREEIYKLLMNCLPYLAPLWK